MNKKVLILGSNGLLGHALVKILSSSYDVVAHTRKDCNLQDERETINYFQSIFPDVVINAAAEVGGVLKNTNHSEKMFANNVAINNNVFRAAYLTEVPQLVNILSTCMFPEEAEYPLTPDQILLGTPHKSAYGYALSKRLSYLNLLYYRQATNRNWINVIPTNIYGPNDNFNKETSHVLASLIRKGFEVAGTQEDFVVWGNGIPFRQFIFSEDLARIIEWALWKYDSDKPLMAVNPAEYSINTLAHIVAAKFDIDIEKIKFDSTKPMGRERMTASSDMKFFKFTSLSEGLNQTIQWYKENQNNLRK